MPKPNIMIQLSTFAVFIILLSARLDAVVAIDQELGKQSANTSRCIRNDHQIQQELSSVIPPIEDTSEDNCYNISKAMFPSVSIPAYYVKVWVHFLDFPNGSKPVIDYSKTLKFTWSEACVYVAVGYVSLTTMSLFSLGTIAPQRRQTELHITLPPFCRKLTKDKKIKKLTYVIATLQDLAINANVSDPRLNTAECVVHGHDGDAEQPLTQFICDGNMKCLLWYHCWFILAASFVVTLIISYPICLWMTNSHKPADDHLYPIWHTSIPFCALSCCLFVGLLVVSICEDIMVYLWYIFAWLVLHIPFPILTYIYCCKCSWFDVYSITWRCCSCRVKIYFFLPALFSLVHNLIWVFVGISTEPIWAIPIFLIECLAVFALWFSFYFYYRDIRNSARTSRKIIAYFSFLNVVLWFLLFTLIIIVQGRIHDNAFNVLAQSAPLAVLVWVVKYVYTDFFIKKKEKNVDESVANGEHDIEMPLTTTRH